MTSRSAPATKVSGLAEATTTARTATYRKLAADTTYLAKISASDQAGRASEVTIGFDTFKLNGCEEMGLIDNSRAVDAAVAVVAEIRAEFGNTIEFGLDFHGRVAAPRARVLIKEREPYRPLFIEEPVLAEQAANREQRGQAVGEHRAVGAVFYKTAVFATAQLSFTCQP